MKGKNIIFLIIGKMILKGCIFIGAMALIAYIQREYNIVPYLWIIDIILLILAPLYYFINNYKEKMKTKKIEDSVIIKNIDFQYYRDIIEEYSPAALSFILDGLEVNKDIGASIIYLLNKGYIEINDEEKIVKTTKDSSNLSKDLQLLCNSDINDLRAYQKLYKKNKDEELRAKKAREIKEKWVELISEQAIKKGLVTQREFEHWFIIPAFFILGVIQLIFASGAKDAGLFVLVSVTTIILIVLRSKAFLNNRFVKTQKGYELYRKVIGLRNYIKDYSNLSDRELKEIAIWDDYLIYAIILNNTSKLNKEAMDFYKKICDIDDDAVKNKIDIRKIYAIISIVIPIVSFLVNVNYKFSFFSLMWSSIIGLGLAIKGRSYNKTLKELGYGMNGGLLITLLGGVLAYIFA